LPTPTASRRASFGRAFATAIKDMSGDGRRTPHFATPGQLAGALDHRTVQTPALNLIDAALMEAFATPNARLIISVPPQEGKSTRVGVYFPLWVLDQKPSTQIVMTSYSDRLAVRNSRLVRNAIEQDGDRINLTLSRDVTSQANWQVAGHRGGIFATSVGGPLTGQHADLMIIDDPHKGAKEADSDTQREDVWTWWESTASTRLAPGAAVVMILTRWHEDDLAGKFLKSDGYPWRLINIPAIADHDPAKGQVDALGRAPGEWLQSARGRSLEEWANIKAGLSARTWNALYQGRPAPAEGGLFKRSDWRFYEHPLWVENEDGQRFTTGKGDQLVMSWDMTFKDTKGSDYVVGQLWLHRGADVYLLDQVRRRMTFSDTLVAFKAMVSRWPQCDVKLVEDKANGTAVIDMLRKNIAGIVAVNPTDTKYARASAVSAFVEAHNVHLPDASLAPWVDEFVEELASFPNSAHDDQVDAFSQALNRMLVRALQGEAFLEAMRRAAAQHGIDPTAPAPVRPDGTRRLGPPMTRQIGG
jgi:predicted phage terminase large subunit-like protein